MEALATSFRPGPKNLHVMFYGFAFAVKCSGTFANWRNFFQWIHVA